MKNDYPLVSIIIDNWDGKHFLEECLPTVFKQNYPNFEVIIIDDCSKDGSGSFLKKNYPDVILIENRKHVGFATANNQGIRKSRGKYVLLLNNDTKVTPDFLFPLVELLKKNPDIAAAQPKIRILPETDLLDDVATYLTLTGFLYHFGFFDKDQPKYNQQLLTFSPKGACFFIRKEVLKKTGLMDERFYCYFEESDLAWRIWLAGYKIFFEPRSLIFHHQAGSQKKQTRPNIDYLAIKNRLNSLITNLSFGSLLLILPLHLIILFFFIFYYLFTLKLTNVLSVLKAFWWNVKNWRLTYLKRQQVQKKIRKISDFNLFRFVLKFPGLSYYLRLFLAYQKGR